MTKKLLAQAIRQSQQTLTKHPEFAHYLHWSFIVQTNQILEYGMNRTGVPEPNWGYKPNSKIHSELSAYKKARGLLKPGPFELINVRLNRQGEWKLSQPCPTCAGWISANGCRKTWFTTPLGWAELTF